MDEFNALLDIAFQTVLAGFEELLFIRTDITQDIIRLLHAVGLLMC